MCLRRKRHSVYRIPMRYKILFLFITIGAVFQLAAQGRVKLTGRVYDSDNQPIELATVRVAGTTMGTMTDLKGEYQLSISAGGKTANGAGNINEYLINEKYKMVAGMLVNATPVAASKRE